MSHEPQVFSGTQATVRHVKHSLHLGPELGTCSYRLHRAKLRFAYHHYRRYIQRHSTLSPQARIVEIGCGPGYLLSFLGHWFPQNWVIGLDYDTRVLERARQQTSRACLVQGTAETLPFKTAMCSVLFALHILEHLYDPQRFVSEAHRVLEPGGILLVATPNPTGISARVMKSHWAEWRDDHVSLHPPGDWVEMLERNGFIRLHTGTTGLSGIPVFRCFPLSLLNYLPLLLFGTLPWSRGEALIALFRRDREQ